MWGRKGEKKRNRKGKSKQTHNKEKMDGRKSL